MPAEVLDLVARREGEKDSQLQGSDELRDELKALGVLVE